MRQRNLYFSYFLREPVGKGFSVQHLVRRTPGSLPAGLRSLEHQRGDQALQSSNIDYSEGISCAVGWRPILGNYISLIWEIVLDCDNYFYLSVGFIFILFLLFINRIAIFSAYNIINDNYLYFLASNVYISYLEERMKQIKKYRIRVF